MERRIVFNNVRVFDGVTPRLSELASVMVKGHTIVEVSQPRSNESFPDVDCIDCGGQTLMPGLIDNHVHIYLNSYRLEPPEPPMTYRAHYAAKFLRHTLSCGFTTVRDVGGGDHGTAMALRDGLAVGPRLIYGGLCLTQTGGHGDFRPTSQSTDYCACGAERNVFAIHADGRDECIKAAREELRKGASHIKIMASGGVLSESDPLERSQYSDEEIAAVVAECERRGAYVCAHCHPAAAIRRCVELGVRSIEHGTLIDVETADVVAQKGAYVVPTMAVAFALSDEADRLALPAASRAKLHRVQERALQGLAIMKRAGVKMGFGTDLFGEHHTRRGTEFTIRRQVLTPFDILHSATALNAEILKMEGRLGVIKPDAEADLLVLDGDPLSDLSLLAEGGRHLSHIMAAGRLVKSPRGEFQSHFD